MCCSQFLAQLHPWGCLRLPERSLSLLACSVQYPAGEQRRARREALLTGEWLHVYRTIAVSICITISHPSPVALHVPKGFDTQGCVDVLSKCVPLQSCCTCHKLKEDGRIPGLTRCVALFSCVGPAGRHRCSGTFRCVFLKVEQSLRGTFAAFVCLRLCRGSPLCERRHAVMLASAQNKAWLWGCIKSIFSLREACKTGVRSNPWSGCGSDPDVCGGAASRTHRSHCQSQNIPRCTIYIYI